MTNSNPLLDKFYELYPEKKEEPKVIKAENPKNGFELKPEFLEQLAKLNPITPITSNLTSPSVATSTTNISITKPPTLKSYDLDDLKASFQQVAEQLQNDKAQVLSMSMEMGYPIGKYCSPKTITFEVRVYEP
jgi:hypothetical protein